MRCSRLDRSTFQMLVLAALAFASAAGAARADVITDWNQKAIPIVIAYSLRPPSYRAVAIMPVAMFDCVNAIEPRYQPYKTKFDADPTTSKDAAVAMAAARVFSGLHPVPARKGL